MRKTAALIALVLVAAMAGAPALAAQEVDQDNSVEIVQVDSTAYPDVSVTLSIPGEEVSTDNLTLTESGENREIRVRPVGTSGLRVALVLDTSASMDGEPFEAMKRSAAAFVELLPEDASAAIVSFSDSVTLEQPFTRNRADLLRAVDGLRLGGGTSLYDGLDAAITALGPPTGTDSVMITLTDGEDTDSSVTQDEVADKIAAADIQFTGIALKTSEGDGSQLGQIAERVGGRVLEIEDPSLLVGLYGLLAASLQTRYEVSFVSGSQSPQNELAFVLDGEPLIASDVTYLQAGSGTPVRPVPPPEPYLIGDAGPLAMPWIPWAAALLIVSGVVGSAILIQNSSRRSFQPATTGFDDTSGEGAGFAFDERIDAAERANPVEMLSGVAGGLTDAAGKILERQGKAKDLDAKIERAGLSMRAGEFGAFILTASLTGLALGFAMGGPILGVAFLLAPGALAPVVLKFLAARRRKKFSDQLGDTLILISGALKAGYGLAQALDSVAAESPPPTSEEFSRALLETRLGLTLEQALDGMDQRMECEDFRWVVNAVKINATVGGDLSKILDQVGDTIRARTKIKRQINALAAEGKISALVLFSLPPGLVFFITSSNPDYVAPLFSTTTGHFILGFAGMLMAVGGLWLKKLVNPEV